MVGSKCRDFKNREVSNANAHSIVLVMSKKNRMLGEWVLLTDGSNNPVKCFPRPSFLGMKLAKKICFIGGIPVFFPWVMGLCTKCPLVTIGCRPTICHFLQIYSIFDDISRYLEWECCIFKQNWWKHFQLYQKYTCNRGQTYSGWNEIILNCNESFNLLNMNYIYNLNIV